MQVLAEDRFAVLDGKHFEIDADQVLIGGNKVEAFHFGVLDGLVDFSAVDEDVIGSHHAGGF